MDKAYAITRQTSTRGVPHAYEAAAAGKGIFRNLRAGRQGMMPVYTLRPGRGSVGFTHHQQYPDIFSNRHAWAVHAFSSTQVVCIAFQDAVHTVARQIRQADQQ